MWHVLVLETSVLFSKRKTTTCIIETVMEIVADEMGCTQPGASLSLNQEILCITGRNVFLSYLSSIHTVELGNPSGTSPNANKKNLR